MRPREPVSAEKATRWALQSTTATLPVLHVALVAMLPSMTALLERHQDDGCMNVLCRIKAQNIASRVAECWLNTQPQIHENGRQLSIVLGFNQARLPLLTGLVCRAHAARSPQLELASSTDRTTSLTPWAPDRHRSCRPRSGRHSVRRRQRQARPIRSTFWDDQQLADLCTDYARSYSGCAILPCHLHLH